MRRPPQVGQERFEVGKHYFVMMNDDHEFWLGRFVGMNQGYYSFVTPDGAVLTFLFPDAFLLEELMELVVLDGHIVKSQR